ncbi:hypothetical protein ACFO4N_01680 [Camelliibacillus cellulosilyticus]|uniref:BclA C-terminal domain-containing protein n=1 Tax=Camelliibacillus cellulosilyticus TaxID=2174486 RepID=A0ABV9GGK3_9BACL
MGDRLSLFAERRSRGPDQHGMRCYKKTVGIATFNSILNLTAETPTTLPFTTPVIVSDGISVFPAGGITVETDGEYLVEFTGNVALSAPNSLSVYANSKFLGYAQLPGFTNFAEIVPLKRGDTVIVIALGALTIQGGALSVAKLKSS